MSSDTAQAAAVQPFNFGLEYIREHFGSNTALFTQQMTHNVYRSNSETLIDHMLRCLDLTGRESLLDLGCGNGFILRDVASRLRAGGRAVAMDISPAMLELAKRNVTVSWAPLEFMEGRAEDLSRFPDGTFDRVMANFIFHYIEDPDLVCGEIARVVSDRGHAIVTIEARHSMPEMYAMHFDAMEKVGFPAEFIARLPRTRRGKMVLDNSAEILSRHFDSVEEKPYPDALRFETPEPYMTFYVDGHRFCGAKAMAGDEFPDSMFDQLYATVEAKVKSVIAEKGYFELSKQNSVFVCK
ncbi:class I SAM-dependent methyltransferase [Micromonospora auratinigra]|uniref:Ubiquinone/menaquinone biosynthesis C-methylase UbiE n=1 Tax=Micromonospora auratinigra TaxID=261654 RepID=A0A1A8ZD58_9ACTN|nr:class I SAM-dependent methyltransferase [Micromonospora auratinigra]SBT41789.1 Ubiquinone/menaquinone biosynthesis C-methylase UbiE [Micromonospora auratinigra]